MWSVTAVDRFFYMSAITKNKQDKRLKKNSLRNEFAPLFSQ